VRAIIFSGKSTYLNECCCQINNYELKAKYFMEKKKYFGPSMLKGRKELVLPIQLGPIYACTEGVSFE
jgi:hypothetical protein